MAEINPPLYVDTDEEYGAEDLGLPYRDLIGEGIVGASDLLVSQRAAGANMSVDVAAGAAWVKGDDDANAQPTYRVRNDATVNLAVTTADATNPRKDLVIAEVLDSTFSGASKTWRLRVVAGTPAASPATPSTPSNALLLAVLTVAAADTSIATADIADSRVRAVVGLGVAGGQRGAKARRTASQSIPTSFPSEAAITWQSERWDYGGYWDSGAPTRFTVPPGCDGLHRMTGCVEWAVNTTGSRRFRIRLNGATIIAVVQDSAATSNNIVQIVTAEYDLVAGDYVEFMVAHGAGVSLTIDVGANYSPEASISRV